jgi:hypothetical protein
MNRRRALALLAMLPFAHVARTGVTDERVSTGGGRPVSDRCSREVHEFYAEEMARLYATMPGLRLSDEWRLASLHMQYRRCPVCLGI